MDVNIVKAAGAVLIAIALIIALIVDFDANKEWALPALTAVLGYVFGNGKWTDRTDGAAPIFTTKKHVDS